MSRTTQLALALVLSCVAIVLLGYTAYEAREKTRNLEDDLVASQARLLDAILRETEFTRVLDSDEIRQTMQQMVEADDRDFRQTLADKIATSLAGTLPKFPEGFIVQDGLNRMVDAALQTERSTARDAIYIAIYGTVDFDPGEEADILLAPILTDITSLITGIGGVGSGLISLLLFVVGGGKRKIEEEMLAVDLDMKRVELAKARHAAREALGNS